MWLSIETPKDPWLQIPEGMYAVDARTAARVSGLEAAVDEIFGHSVTSTEKQARATIALGEKTTPQQLEAVMGLLKVPTN